MNREMLERVIDNFNYPDLNRFFRVNGNYAEYMESWPQYDGDRFADFQKLGELRFDGGERLIVTTSHVNRELSERSGKKDQYEKAKRILKEQEIYDAGFFVFHDESGNSRFSLVYGQAEGTKKAYSNFRRFTYFVSRDQTNKTFLDRVGGCGFTSLAIIKDAFSVEKVTKAFYKEVADWYFWAAKNVTFPEAAEKETNGRNVAVIRMITRLIFIWFMKERKLVSPDLFNKEKISALLKSLKPHETTYYKAILQNLFFATLNTAIEDRRFRFDKAYHGKNKDYMEHGIYRYEDYFKNQEDMLVLFKNIPFLNGGLFDCLDQRVSENGQKIEVRVDGFTDKEVGLSVPNLLFFSDEVYANLNEDYGTKNKKYKVQGLLNILSAYNFTIDENDPNDQEVALDPELLGKVFENLLASFNPETATTARKATGSYYTPREIVDYMVTQSLKQYYKTHLSDVTDIDNKLKELLSPITEEPVNPFGEIDSKRVVRLTEELRIVDPAVGSGAFPMGILNKLVAVLDRVDHNNRLWQEAQLKAVEAVTDQLLKQKLIKQINEQFTEKNSNYGRKLYLIQKCIYGVDIQQIAIEIAKLRFFIALLVDEKIDKSKHNWGVEPLPNLEFKLMQGNSLISEFMGINLDAEDSNSYSKLMKDETEELIAQFQDKKGLFQYEPDRVKKKVLKKEIDEIIIRIFESRLKIRKADYSTVIKRLQQKYSLIPASQERDEALRKDTEILNQKYGMDLDLVEKQLRGFTTGQKVKPFFAWKLYFAEVFHEKKGFDVVIANPPYIQLQKDSGKLANLYEDCGYKTFKRTSDIYALFYECGINLLRDGGHLCYITSNKWMRSGYGESLRSYFLTKYPKLLIDLGPGVFENATVDTNIVLVQNTPNKHCLYGLTLTKEAKGKELTEYIYRHIAKIPKTTKAAWYIGSDAEQQLKEKIEKRGKPLRDWDISINYGIKTGLTEAFIIDSMTKERICSEDHKSIEIIKPILRGKNIKRYGYIWAGLWLIQSGFDINIPKLYPAVYRHLLRYIGKAKKRDDQGKNWWNLRACAYYPEFEKEKIIWQEISQEPTFSYDYQGIYCIDTGRILTGKHIKYLIGIFNSNFFQYTFSHYYAGGGLGEKGVRYKGEFMKNYPISPITPENQQTVKQIEKLVEEILATKKQNLNANMSSEEHQIDQMVYELYGLTPEEIDLVEGGRK